MGYKILQINFNYNVPTTDFEQAVMPLADPIKAVPGMLWKTWLLNAGQREAGGIYLFADDASLQTYLAGSIVAGIKSNPALSNISAKVFDVMVEPSAVTRAPLRDAVPV
jgi:hypothetical protein